MARSESPARWRVRAAFCGQPPLTQQQLRAALGGNDAPAAINYHVRKLVAAGILEMRWSGQRFRYSLRGKKRSKRRAK